MPTFRLSRRAETDLLEIGSYTFRRRGAEQAGRYLNELEGHCRMLADSPQLGRNSDEIRPGLRCLEHGRHVVFYRVEAKGVLVVRILHQRMLPTKHR